MSLYVITYEASLIKMQLVASLWITIMKEKDGGVVMQQQGKCYALRNVVFDKHLRGGSHKQWCFSTQRRLRKSWGKDLSRSHRLTRKN